MKKTAAQAAILTPDVNGWRLLIAGAPDQVVASLAEVADLISAETAMELALPCNIVLVDLHKLPTTEASELGDMVNLQLEKALPFPIEEVSSGFEVIKVEENETTLLSIAASHASLDQLCNPLRNKKRLPERITLHALRVATRCGVDDLSLVLWAEHENLAVALVDHGRLSWVQPVAADLESLLVELPGILLSAELEGVATAFSTIALAPGCEHLQTALETEFNKPVRILPEDSVTISSKLDLLPSSWTYEASRRKRRERLKQQLVLVAALYLILVASAFAYIGWLKREVRKVDATLAEMEPRFGAIAAQEERWRVLEPAVDPKFFTAEIVHQLTKHCNPDVLKFTAFVQTAQPDKPEEWILRAEAKNTDQASIFFEMVKKEPDLKGWDIPLTFPDIKELPDGRVTFSITGKRAAPEGLALQ